MKPYIPTLRIGVKMPDITEAIEPSIGPKKLLERRKLRDTGFRISWEQNVWNAENLTATRLLGERFLR